METDPNWLYSTIAQSAAAIVAIIGGFITSNLLALTAEKNSLKNQLKDKKTILETYKTSNVDMTIPNVKLIAAEIPILEERIKYFSYPPYLRLGAFILLLFAFFSILLPVNLILTESFSPLIKNVTFYIFMAGLFAVIVYVILLIAELRRK